MKLIYLYDEFMRVPDGEEGQPVYIFDGELNEGYEISQKVHEYRYFLAKNKTNITNCLQKTISLVPFSKTEGIETAGLEYPLNKETLLFGNRIGTRNKAVKNNVLITFKTGNLFIFISNT